MTLRSTLAAATLVLAGSLVPAVAEEVRPAQAGSVTLGALSGVAYYTAEPTGYRVVVTLAQRGAAPALRFETVLAADQSVTLSTPRVAGEAAEVIRISREGDRVRIAPAAIRTQTAAAVAE